MKNKIIILLSLLLTGCTVNYNLEINKDTLNETITGTVTKEESSQDSNATGLSTIYSIINEEQKPIYNKEELYQKDFKESGNNINYTFKYNYFAADKLLTEAMIASGAVCIAYETVEKEDRSLPLLTPMSEVAGRMATQVGARFLEKPQGGKGKLMGGVTGVRPARVLILGGGIVGTNAAQIAAGMGAEVLIADINLPRLRYLSEVMPKNVKTLYSSLHNIKMELPTIDLVIGSVLIPGDKAPHLITKEMLKMMKPGTVLVDVAIDQGGCFETSHPTTHSDPTYIVDGIVHYAVANIPGAVPFTSTMALTNATLPYTVALACKGWRQACKDDPALALGLNVVEGKVTYKAVADVFGLKYEAIEL